MACVHNLIKNYRPELELEEPLTAEELVEHVAEETELDSETVRKVFEALPDALHHYLLSARPVELPGVGRIKPAMDLNGKIRGELETHEALVERLSEPDAYSAGINRRENIGADLSRLAQMWNSSHPDDPVRDVDAYAVVGA